MMWGSILCFVGLHQWRYVARWHLTGHHQRISPLPPMPLCSLRQCDRCDREETYSPYLGNWS